MKWQASFIGQFYECGEEKAVYFDPQSGDTHLISEFASYLIRHIYESGRPLTVEDIIELLTDDFEAEDQVALNQAVPAILIELTDLDIVTRA